MWKYGQRLRDRGTTNNNKNHNNNNYYYNNCSSCSENLDIPA